MHYASAHWLPRYMLLLESANDCEAGRGDESMAWRTLRRTARLWFWRPHATLLNTAVSAVCVFKILLPLRSSYVLRFHVLYFITVVYRKIKTKTWEYWYGVIDCKIRLNWSTLFLTSSGSPNTYLASWLCFILHLVAQLSERYPLWALWFYLRLQLMPSFLTGRSFIYNSHAERGVHLFCRPPTNPNMCLYCTQIGTGDPIDNCDLDGRVFYCTLD